MHQSLASPVTFEWRGFQVNIYKSDSYKWHNGCKSLSKLTIGTCRMLKRAALALLAVAFTLLGLVGLLIPILPGFLFLILAAVCMSALSPRFERRIARHPAWRGWKLRWRESRGLPFHRRIQLAFWLTAEAAMKAVGRR
jgi:uncharacterized membrane protein YbaN (DUF454 family)